MKKVFLKTHFFFYYKKPKSFMKRQIQDFTMIVIYTKKINVLNNDLGGFFFINGLRLLKIPVQRSSN